MGHISPMVRDREPEDDAGIIRLYTLQESDGLPLTIEAYRERGAAEQLVAVGPGGEVVGYGTLELAWWTGRPDVFTIEVRVDAGCTGRGIGSTLFESLLERARSAGAKKLLTWVRDDAPDAVRFAEHRGFEPAGEVLQDYTLDLRAAQLDSFRPLIDQLAHEGIVIERLCEIGLGEEFLHELHLLWADSGNKPPDPAKLRGSFDTWQREVLFGTGLSPDWHWVALDRSQPVGMSFLKRLSADAAENDYTGVLREYRGRGIARALKIAALDWACENGFRFLYTCSEVENTPMISINRSLGYVPGPRRVRMERAL